MQLSQVHILWVHFTEHPTLNNVPKEFQPQI